MSSVGATHVEYLLPRFCVVENVREVKHVYEVRPRKDKRGVDPYRFTGSRQNRFGMPKYKMMRSHA